jgi:hypothetical protein
MNLFLLPEQLDLCLQGLVVCPKILVLVLDITFLVLDNLLGFELGILSQKCFQVICTEHCNLRCSVVRDMLFESS